MPVSQNSVDRHFYLFSMIRKTRIVDMETAGTAETVDIVETAETAGTVEIVGTVDMVGIRRIRHQIRTLGIMHCLINYQ